MQPRIGLGIEQMQRLGSQALPKIHLKRSLHVPGSLLPVNACQQMLSS